MSAVEVEIDLSPADVKQLKIAVVQLDVFHTDNAV